jgi:hypothetical protein
VTQRINKYLITILATTIVVLAFAISVNSYTVFFLFLLLLVFVIAFGLKSKEFSFLLFPFCGNILFNIVLNRIYMFEYGEPYFMGGSDDKWSFEYMSSLVLEQRLLFDVNALLDGLNHHNSILYVHIVAFFMKIADSIDRYYTIIPVFVNSFILTLTGARLYKIANKHYMLDIASSKKMTILFLCFPLIVFFSSHVFRDTLVNFIIISIFYYLLFNRRWFKYLKILVCLGALVFLRIEYVAFFGIVVALYILNKSISSKKVLRNVYLTLGVIIAVIMIRNIALIDYFLGEIEMYDNFRVKHGSPTLERIFGLPIYLRVPAKFVFLLLNPSPSFGTIEQGFLGLGTVIQFFLTPFTFYGVIKEVRKRDILSITFLLMFLMIGIVSVDAKHKFSLVMLGIIPTYLALQKVKILYGKKEGTVPVV